MNKKHINLNNILCKDCKHKVCICNADDDLKDMYNFMKEPTPAKEALGRAISLMSELRKIANKHGYFLKKEPQNEH